MSIDVDIVSEDGILLNRSHIRNSFAVRVQKRGRRKLV